MEITDESIVKGLLIHFGVIFALWLIVTIIATIAWDDYLNETTVQSEICMKIEKGE